MAATKKPRTARPPLSEHRVVVAAVKLADRHGIDAVTMRSLARELGVEAMSLYHHVPNRDAILDGMVDAVFAEIALSSGSDWKEALRDRATRVRSALSHHKWAIGLMDSRRNPGPHTLGHHNAVLGTLRGAGFTLALAAHAYALLDSYVYGFVLQELSLPFDSTEGAREVAQEILAALPVDAYPHLVELTTNHVLAEGYSFASEFHFGLTLVLDGLELQFRARPRQADTPMPSG
jgi:AcrR family transcriptional regulator